MANVFAINPVPAGSVMPVVNQLGGVPFKMTAGATYATAAGGLPVSLAELNLLLQGMGIEMQVKPSDIVYITADAFAAGAAYRTVWVRQSDFTWLVRITNGITEIADGALTTVIQGLMFFSKGSPS